MDMINRAYIFMCLYALIQSITWALVRFLSEDLSTATLFLFRNLVGAITVIPMLLKYGPRILHSDYISLHFVRAFAAFTGGLALFYAVAHAPFTVVVSITFTAPILASFGAAVIFREVITRVKVIALVVGFVGVLLVLRPASDGHSAGLFIAIIAAIIGSVMTAVAFLSVKRLSQTEQAATVVAYPFLFILPASIVLAYFDWTTPELASIPLLIVMGVGISISQYCMVKALSFADASSVLPFDFLRLVAASILGAVYFGDIVDAWVWAGGIIIFYSSLILVKYDKSQTKKTELA